MKPSPIRTAGAALLLCIALAGQIRAAPPATAPATRPAAPLARAEVDQTFQPLIDGEWCPAVVVGVVTRDGRQVFGYGRMSDQDARPPAGDTLFEIGSVSKVFTSLLLAEAVQAGDVSLQDPVQKYLPDSVKVPQKGDKPITLLSLATHTSGLPRLPTNFHPADPTNPYADYSVEQLYAFLTDYKLTRAPGEGFEYSNLGAGLLGHVLARRAGKTYEETLAAGITKPLGMSDTAISLSADQKRRLAAGHDADGNPIPNWDFPTLAGAGGIRSTVDDMLKFAAAEAGLSDVPPAIKEAIALSQLGRATAQPGMDIALGWHINTATGVRWHNGQTGGYHSLVVVSPERGFGVVALTNGSGVVEIPTNAVIRRLLGEPLEKPTLPTVIKLDEKALDRVAGTYVLGPGALGAVLTVTREGNRLFAQLTGQPRFRIYPQSESRFFWKVVDARLEFTLPEGQPAGKLVLHQNGNDISGWRMRPPEPGKPDE